MGADNWLYPEPNKTILFFSLHVDGSPWGSKARDFSVGYPVPSDPSFAQTIANEYKRLTNFGRRKDNYTSGLRQYYAWRKKHISADFYCLLEHGFFTNPIEKTWILNHLNEIAECHYNSIINFLKNISNL